MGVEALGPLTVALGVVSPFGLIIRYPDNGPFSSAVTRSSLPLIDIKPTIAYKITDYLSIGLGADIFTFASFIGDGHFELKNTAQVAPGVSRPTELNGNGTAAGFNASVLFSPLRNADGKPRFNLGFIYRSRTTLHLNGQFLVNGTPTTDATTTAVLPQIWTGAIAVWPIRDERHEWKLEYDMDFIDWNEFKISTCIFQTAPTRQFLKIGRPSMFQVSGRNISG